MDYSQADWWWFDRTMAALVLVLLIVVEIILRIGRTPTTGEGKMGFLGKLIDDVLDIPGKVVDLPGRAVKKAEELACAATEGHEWGPWAALPFGHALRICTRCGAVKRR